MLDAEVHPSFAWLLGSSWPSIFPQGITYLKKKIPIAAFTIGKEAQIMRLSRNRVSWLHCLWKEFAILLATI
jgi:hypothetical protein